MESMADEQPALRVALVGIVVVSLFATLFARLYYLQILRQTTVEEVFGGPRLREIAYPGVRGRIVDRNGTVLVDNRESIVVTIDRQRFEGLEHPESLQLRLARALNDAGYPTKVSDIAERIADPRYDPLEPVPIAEDISAELESYLLERLHEFPSVDVVRRQIRVYPYGSLAAHVLGYTGAINSEELEARQGDPKAYEPGDEIGKSGVERIFESELRATPGRRTIEVDATEREIATRADVPSQPGSDLQLSIDAGLQQHVEVQLRQALVEARQQRRTRPTDPELRAPAGAVVVLDSTNGEVLAMASYPTYDPSEFVGGISAYRFNELTDPAAFFPFTNRAVQSIYSPGSTFKPFTAAAALDRGVIAADEVIVDNGLYELEDCTDTCVFSNAGGTRYGKVDLRRAMTVSSDVYFYRLGEQMWVKQGTFGKTAIQDTARNFGLGSVTGVQLPGEASGLISDPAFKKARHDDNPEAFPFGEWFTGDNVNLAIGQGDVGVTPLQLANAYAVFANGGTLYATSVARALLDHDSGAVRRTYASRLLSRVDLPPAVRRPIVEGLVGVVTDKEGTAYDAFTGFPLASFDVAGKTGTAEVPPKADTALFAAFGPVPTGRYVVVAVMEESGFAAPTAAPLVRRVFEGLDELKARTPAPVTPAQGAVAAGSAGGAPVASVPSGPVPVTRPAVTTSAPGRQRADAPTAESAAADSGGSGETPAVPPAVPARDATGEVAAVLVQRARPVAGGRRAGPCRCRSSGPFPPRRKGRPCRC